VKTSAVGELRLFMACNPSRGAKHLPFDTSPASLYFGPIRQRLLAAGSQIVLVQ
jgi:hypothetical protein